MDGEGLLGELARDQLAEDGAGGSLIAVARNPTPEDFCRSLLDITPRSFDYRMVQTIADRLGIDFDAAETLAIECAGRGWLHTNFMPFGLRTTDTRSLP